MRKIRLGEVVGENGVFVDGDWIESKDQDPNGEVRLIQLADIGVGSFKDKSDRFLTKQKAEDLGCTYLKKGDLLLARLPDPLGRTCVFPGFNYDCVTAVDICIIRIENPEVDKDWLMYVLNSPIMKDEIDKYTTGTTRKRISRKNLQKIEIPLPSLSEQKAIVAKLDRAQRLIDIDKEMLTKYDEFIQSVFLEMFGDPVANPKGWELGSINDYGSLKNGLNYSSNESGIKIRSLGVGDFGVLSKIDNVRAISRIELDEAPPENYLLKDNDLVFVRSNGNKELVGRCLVIYPGNEDVTFSGFCIRYRPNSLSINTTYLSHLFRVKTFRNYMLKDGRGANIQNINQKLLSQLDIPLPDISKQNQFAKNVEKLEGQILKTQTSLKKSEELFSSLMQIIFNKNKN